MARASVDEAPLISPVPQIIECRSSLYFLVISATGLDIDDRLQFGTTYLESVRVWMDSLVGFSRSIPGFKELPMKDQYHLLKRELVAFNCIRSKVPFSHCFYAK